MFDVTLSNDYLVQSDGTSEGTQDKYFKEEYWYKVNRFGDEATAEVLSSLILSCSSLKAGDYVVYEDGVINQFRGCTSRNFLKDGEILVTLYRFYEQLTGRKINEIINRMSTPKERAEYVLDFFREHAGIDLSGYFRKVFTLDLLNLNEDRHFNNLAIIRCADGHYREAPLFDNGKALFIGNYSVNKRVTFEENRKRIIALPFSASCDRQYELFGKGFRVDFDTVFNRLHSIDLHLRKTDCYAVLMKNLEFVRGKYPELEWRV